MNLTEQTEIALYVEEVRQALDHLPAATREELIEDLPEHLAEVLAEGPGTLTERLGTPQAYAAELVASAGITGAARRPHGGAVRIAELRGRLGDAARRADVRVGPVIGYERASDFLALLRPAWWVLRGYAAAMLFAYAMDSYSWPLGLLPRVGDNELVALLVLAAFVIGSIWLGRRAAPAKPLPRMLLLAGSAGLALFAVVGFFEVDGNARNNAGYTSPPVINYVSDGGMPNEHGDIQDVFVYDGQGRLVQGAQLYDQDGKPIRFGERAVSTRRAATGTRPGPSVTRTARSGRRTGPRRAAGRVVIRLPGRRRPSPRRHSQQILRQIPPRVPQSNRPEVNKAWLRGRAGVKAVAILPCWRSATGRYLRIEEPHD